MRPLAEREVEEIAAPEGTRAEVLRPCYHCGVRCDGKITADDKAFCCTGCRGVHELLAESGLTHFYDLAEHPGNRITRESGRAPWAYLDQAEAQRRLLEFSDGRQNRITFHIPSIHCIACVWVLENLFRMNPQIGWSQVNFARREVSVRYDASLALSQLVQLLASLGYEPLLTLQDLEPRVARPGRKRLQLQIGLAGFAFGNIMLFSVPSYLGLDPVSGPEFRRIFGVLSLILALPVLFYSAADYFRSAWLSFRQRYLTLDVPIALGLLAIYGQSIVEIFTGRGEGYLDSFAGLVFFLLCGRAFQQLSFDRLAFDRDFRCFFPLAVMRQTANGEAAVGLSEIRPGDQLRLRNGELLPADARLIQGPALIDYSFVTGESEPVKKEPGDYLYAGGRQVGGAVQVETVRAVSQSYLTSLWSSEAFAKSATSELNTLTNRYGKRFTRLVIGLAVGGAAFWAILDPSRSVRVFSSVLIVACPCALALAAPFALGTAQRLLARQKIFLKSAQVLERLARTDTIAVDKTGTLTAAEGANVQFFGPALCERERGWVHGLARESTHPSASRIARSLSGTASPEVIRFGEEPGLGIHGWVDGREICLGSFAHLQERGVRNTEKAHAPGSVACLAIDGEYRGTFLFSNALRAGVQDLIQELRGTYQVALLSGDNAREASRYADLFGPGAELHFEQSPLDKLNYVRRQQKAGGSVMMVGDGLNDAVALRQSDVGVAVVEELGVFSPASDVIMEGGQVPRLGDLLAFSRRIVRVVHWSFLVSAIYNAAGLFVAVAGWLSPLFCAIVMPLSSVSVVAFACLAANRAGRRCGFNEVRPPSARGAIAAPACPDLPPRMATS